MARSLIRFVSQEKQLAMPLGDDPIRYDEVKEQVLQQIRTQVGAVSGDADVKVSFDDEGVASDAIVVDYDNEEDTEAILEILKGMLEVPEVLDLPQE